MSVSSVFTAAGFTFSTNQPANPVRGNVWPANFSDKSRFDTSVGSDYVLCLGTQLTDTAPSADALYSTFLSACNALGTGGTYAAGKQTGGDTPTGRWVGVAAVVSGASVATESIRSAQRGLIAFRSALDMGLSTAWSCNSDSTGDSTDPTEATTQDRRLFRRFADKLARRYSATHHSMVRFWDDTAQDYGPYVTVLAHPDGQRYARTTTRSLRLQHNASDRVPIGLVTDMRMDLSADKWAGAGKNQTLVARTVNDALTNDSVIIWRLNNSGVLEVGWSGDGTAIGTFRQSSVVVPATDGQRLSVRCTLEITSGVRFDVKFYTAPSISGPWTQLGATVGQAGAYTVPNQSTAPFWEIGAQNWQPAVNGLTGKIYEVDVRSSLNGPSILPRDPELWQAYPDSSTNFGGAPTIRGLIGARSGSDLTYHTNGTRMPLLLPNYGQAVHFFNDGHNEGGNAGDVTWLSPVKAHATSVATRLPRASFVPIGQNPHTSAWTNEAAYGYAHQQRIREMSAYAAAQGWGFVNVFTKFLADPRGVAALVSVDGLHPVADGYDVGATALMEAVGFNG